MLRRAFKFLAVLSLLAGAITVWLWVRSYGRPLDIFFTIPIRPPDPLPNADENWPRECGSVQIVHDHGVIYCLYTRGETPPEDYGLRLREPYRATTYRGWFEPTLMSKVWTHGALGLRVGTQGTEMRQFNLICRDVTLLAALGVLPTVWLLARLRPLVSRLRRPPGTCKRCGYNLTGNVTGVCSECGAPVAKSAC